MEKLAVISSFVGLSGWTEPSTGGAVVGSEVSWLRGKAKVGAGGCRSVKWNTEIIHDVVFLWGTSIETLLTKTSWAFITQ